MKRKELTKTFVMSSNLKNPSVSMVYIEIFQRRRRWHNNVPALDECLLFAVKVVY